jgi:poly-beta-1,6-N-acetyl-D-glucosamine synthase
MEKDTILFETYTQISMIIDRFFVTSGFMNEIAIYFPMFLLIEIPVQFLMMYGVLKYWFRETWREPKDMNYYPDVSCIITFYGEGEASSKSINSLTYQYYPGKIEILAIIDGAQQNKDTYNSVLSTIQKVKDEANRDIKVIPKWKRGGKVSSLNSGLEKASHDIVMSLDGETSFDNDMVYQVTRHFNNKNVVAVSGNLRIRNGWESVTTAMQSIEYMIAITLGKTGLNEFRVVNNISGAFGVFRKKVIKHIGGWENGAAEDLDITMRMKNYFRRHPEMKIVFDPKATGHTDGPVGFWELIKQRERWDGDLSYIYLKKFKNSLSPKIIGWREFIFYVGYGLFFQIIMPFFIIFYNFYYFFAGSLADVLTMNFFIFLYYTIFSFIMYLQYIFMLSDRIWKDLMYLPLIPIFPFYLFATRIGNAVATVKELFLDAHKDTSMAPWWVLKKVKTDE